MKIKWALLIIALFFTFSGCKSKDFPDSITSEITNEHFRIKGTKLYVIKPKDYTYFEDANVFKCNDSVFIQCLYMPSNFIQSLNTNKFDFFYNKNYEVISRKEFIINNTPGVYYKLKEKNFYWLYFMFGNYQVENRIVACFPINSSFQDIVFEFVEKAYYKQDFNLDPMENAKFKIDFSDVGFNFITYSMNQFTFAEKNSEEYAKKKEKSNLISISQLPPVKDYHEYEKTANIMIQSMQNQGIIIKETLISKFDTINSYNDYKVIFKGEVEKKEMYLYMIITGNSKVQLQITIILYHDGKGLIPKFDQVVKTLKLNN